MPENIDVKPESDNSITPGAMNLQIVAGFAGF